jgi:hypothetical protein
MDANQAAGDEIEPWALELAQEREEVLRREELHHRRIVRRVATQQEAKAVLQPERIRNRPDERPAGAQQAVRLVDERPRLDQVLEQLTRHDDVEALVPERQPSLRVGPHRLDPELGRLRERGTVDVDPHDRVAVEVRAGQRTGPTAHVEHAAPRTADVPAEQRRPLRRGEDELAIANGGVVLPVASLDVLERLHPQECRDRLREVEKERQ